LASVFTKFSVASGA